MASYLEDEIYTELDDAIYQDAYTFLDSSEKGRKYLAGVREALRKGATPSEIKSRMQSKIGIDREALALRCGQAAHFILRTEFATPEVEPSRRKVDVGVIGNVVLERPMGR